MMASGAAVVIAIVAVAVGAAVAAIIRFVLRMRRDAALTRDVLAYGKPLVIDVDDDIRPLSHIRNWLLRNFRYPGRIWISRLSFNCESKGKIQ